MTYEEQPIETNAIEQYLMDYKEGIGYYTKHMPEVIQSYNAFTEACFEEGALPQKVKQLIGLGISLYAQNEHCIIYHTKGCLDHGCTDEEILEGMGVAAAIGGGAVMSQGVTLVQECIEELKQHKH